MPAKDPHNLLKDGAAALGLTLTPRQLEQLQLYLQELQRWNTRINLTSLKTERDIIRKHFLDSLAVLPFLGEAHSLADLGSGAGFPGLVLKLARPQLALTLVESRGKKAAFLDYLVGLLGLPEVEVVQAYVTPKLARTWGRRFAAVVSRAALPLARLLQVAAPLLLPGGRLLALKGPQLPGEEIQAAGKLCPSLGLSPLSCQGYELPLSREPRLVIMAIANQSP